MAWFWVRIAISVVFASVLAYDIYKISKRESGVGQVTVERPRYRPYLLSYLLPLYMLLAALLLVWNKDDYVVQDAVFRVLGMFLHISIYYVVLLVILPYLRRRVSARVCALLWILPNYLYVMISLSLVLPAPWWIIPLPDVSVALLLGIWLSGFVAVMGWKIVSHLRFRKSVLKQAEPVTDPMILRVWGETQDNTKVLKTGDSVKRYIPIVWSDGVKTPLTIGLWRGGMYMVLPKRAYSEEELRLILQHEIIHIGREDSWTKFFLIFCTAMCWFNPLMWTAMKRCAEDVELSCDETVLLGAEDVQRKQYAQLLLKTAGDDRGFTTCLSATGQAMRYRVGLAMDAPKRRFGLMVAGAVAIALFMSCGLLTFSYDYGTGAEVIFRGDQEYQIRDIRMDTIPEGEISAASVERALQEYLSQLQVYRLGGEYGVKESEHSLFFAYGEPTVWVHLYDQKLEVFRPERGTRIEVYYLEEPVDWDHVQTLLMLSCAINSK